MVTNQVTKTPAMVLREAAAIIERDGWCQGDYRDGKKRCAVGAIADARPPDWPDRLFDAVDSAIEAVVGTAILPDWNDAPGRTKDEVIAALLSAANQAESTHGK